MQKIMFEERKGVKYEKKVFQKNYFIGIMYRHVCNDDGNSGIGRRFYRWQPVDNFRERRDSDS